MHGAGNTSTGALVGAGTLKRLAGVLELTCWVASVSVPGAGMSGGMS